MSKYIISAGALIIVIVCIISKYRFSRMYKNCIDECDFDSRVKESWMVLFLKAVWIICLAVLIQVMKKLKFIIPAYDIDPEKVKKIKEMEGICHVLRP